MYREDFIDLVKEMGLPYKEAKHCGWPDSYDGIYVTVGEDYIRVSDFGSHMYIRDNGDCYHINDTVLIEKLEEMKELKEYMEGAK